MRTMLMIGVLATVGAMACGGGGGPAGGPPAASAPAPAASPAAAAGAMTHDIRGRIEAIGAERRTVTLDHEAIPGVMAAMEMEYQVREPAVLEGLSAGDRVQGQIEMRPGGQYVVIQLRK